jgi:hypothetical protein
LGYRAGYLITGSSNIDIGNEGGGTGANQTTAYIAGNGTGLSYVNAAYFSGTVGNAQLANSSITINAGTGLSGGGTLALGGSITLNATGGGGRSGTTFSTPLTAPSFQSDAEGDFVAGLNNTASGGGYAYGSYNAVGGGYNNHALDGFSTVGGGYDNTANGTLGTVGRGYQNQATNSYATVPGGS